MKKVLCFKEGKWAGVSESQVKQPSRSCRSAGIDPQERCSQPETNCRIDLTQRRGWRFAAPVRPVKLHLLPTFSSSQVDNVYSEAAQTRFFSLSLQFPSSCHLVDDVLWRALWKLQLVTPYFPGVSACGRTVTGSSLAAFCYNFDFCYPDIYYCVFLRPNFNNPL